MPDILPLSAHDYIIDGEPQFQARLESRSDTHVALKVFEAHGWGTAPDGTSCPHWDPEPIVSLSMKWDGCSHLGFRDPVLGKEWVHVCGPEKFEQYLLMLQWAWNLARSLIPEFDSSVGGGEVEVVKVEGA